MPTFQQLLNKLGNHKNHESLIKDFAKKISKITGRQLLVYASDFNKNHPLIPNSIHFSDKTCFSDLIEDINSDKVDIFIQSPGGSAEVTKAIVGQIRDKFKHVRFIIPNMAKSAATMMILSGDELLMDSRSELGPIDPQIQIQGIFVPAQTVLDGFNKAKETILKEGVEITPVYLPLLNKCDLHILQICEDALEMSQKLVKQWLAKYMFNSNKDKVKLAEKAARFFASRRKHLSHASPITIDDVKKLGLRVFDMKNDKKLQNAVWKLYCLIELFFDRSPVVKIYENSQGTFLLKQLPVVSVEPKTKKQNKKDR